MIEINLIKQTLNIDQLKEKLKAAGERALNSVAYKISDKSKDLVPVKTGALRRSIHFENVGDKKELKMLPYGLYVELGTVHTGPHPFIHPAVSEEGTQKVFTEELKKQL